MTYKPTESLTVTWPARNKSWRYLTPRRRGEITAAPSRFRELTVDDLPDDEGGRFVRMWCARWTEQGFVATRDDDYRGNGLLLIGAPGVGKTRLAAIAARHVSDCGISTKFVQAKDYYDLALQIMREHNEERRELLEGAFECFEAGWGGWRLVVLDDLGKEYTSGSGFSENRIDGLIRSRYVDDAPSIVTTNLTLDEIGDRYGASMQSYVQEAFWVVKVKGKDHRVVD